MKLYLLDTNTLSYFIKGINPGLHTRMARGLHAQDVAMSAITHAELRYGQSLMAANDKRRRAIDLVFTQVPTLPWDAAAADQYGILKALLKQLGKPIGEMDTQIAAHALAEQLILVSHNTRHFDKLPDLQLENWMK